MASTQLILRWLLRNYERFYEIGNMLGGFFPPPIPPPNIITVFTGYGCPQQLSLTEHSGHLLDYLDVLRFYFLI